MPAVPVLASRDISAQSSCAGVCVGEDGVVFASVAAPAIVPTACFSSSSKRVRRDPEKKDRRWDCEGTGALGREIMMPDCWADQRMVVSRLLETWLVLVVGAIC